MGEVSEDGKRYIIAIGLKVGDNSPLLGVPSADGYDTIILRSNCGYVDDDKTNDDYYANVTERFRVVEYPRAFGLRLKAKRTRSIYDATQRAQDVRTPVMSVARIAAAAGLMVPP